MAQCTRPVYVKINGEPFKVPCGRCYNCRKNRQNQWFVRMKEETKHSRATFFITLTYNDDNVCKALDIMESSYDFEHDCWNQPQVYRDVLNPVDVTLFFKRFRKELDKKYGIKVRYFLCGEYGPKTLRPHYHAVIWCSKPISRYIFTEILTRAWSLGFVVVSKVTEARMYYVTKYITYKYELPPFYKIYPCFIRCSKGIGKGYLTPSKIEYHRTILFGYENSINGYYYLAEDGFKFPLPRYYKDRIYSNEQKKKIRLYFAYEAAKRLQQLQLEYYKAIKEYERRGETRLIKAFVERSKMALHEYLWNEEREKEIIRNSMRKLKI